MQQHNVAMGRAWSQPLDESSEVFYTDLNNTFFKKARVNHCNAE